jgi:signal transduction histidine kinase
MKKYYKLVVNTQATAMQPWVHRMTLEIREIPLNTVSMDRDMFLDNKTIAVEQEEKNIKLQKIRINFSFKREVFFIVAGSLMGAVVMAIPMTFLYVGIGSGYYLPSTLFGHIVGVHSSISSIISIASITTAVVILIVFLIKWNSSLDREVKRRTKEFDQSNKQLVLANKKLESANEQLKVHDNMQNEFINIAAHELRTPIQPIILLSESLKSTIKDNEQISLINVISRNAKRLRRLTEDILDVTRIESKSLKLHKEQFNLNDIIVNTINDIKINRYFNNKNDIKILYECKDIFVKADKERLSQVIFNLLSNAIKFTNGEGGDISIISDEKDNQTIVSIKDTGTGIDPAILPRLFSKFAKSFENTGLGLFISKSIIESHGGRIWAKNNADGRGATFSFSLPIK